MGIIDNEDLYMGLYFWNEHVFLNRLIEKQYAFKCELNFMQDGKENA